MTSAPCAAFQVEYNIVPSIWSLLDALSKIDRDVKVLAGGSMVSGNDMVFVVPLTVDVIGECSDDVQSLKETHGVGQATVPDSVYSLPLSVLHEEDSETDALQYVRRLFHDKTANGQSAIVSFLRLVVDESVEERRDQTSFRFQECVASLSRDGGASIYSMRAKEAQQFLAELDRLNMAIALRREWKAKGGLAT